MPPASEVAEVINALSKLIQDGELQDRFGDPTQADAVLKKLNLPNDVGQEVRLFLERCRARKCPDVVRPPGALGSEESKSDETLAYTQLEAFSHIRSSFRVAIGMSILMFIMGAVMLMTAFFRAVSESVLSQGTLAIGGMALADFAILFFRQPWKDVAANLANSQRARLLATSYLVGLSLIKSKDAEGLQRLIDLTDRSVSLLTERSGEEKGISPIIESRGESKPGRS